MKGVLRVVALLSALFLLASAGKKKKQKSFLKKQTAFLKKNKDAPGVLSLPSGLQYKALVNGSGSFHPAADSSCSCHYAGTLIDGTEFDSSYGRGSPSDFAPNQVIKGWTEAMQLMVEGDTWELYIPSELGYGEHGSPPKISGGATLVFKMELIKIKGAKVYAGRCDPVTEKGCSQLEKNFIKKRAGSSMEENEEKALRLTKRMEEKKLSHSKMGWTQQRLHIVNHLVAAAAGSKEDL